MNRVPFYFFMTGVVSVFLGMLLGIQMSMSGNFDQSPVHAHLNLVGWVTFALFGVYYFLVPQATQGRLAMIHYIVALAGLVLMIGGLSYYIGGGTDAIVAIGSMITAVSMLIFLYVVFTHGFARSSTA